MNDTVIEIKCSCGGTEFELVEQCSLYEEFTYQRTSCKHHYALNKEAHEAIVAMKVK